MADKTRWEAGDPEPSDPTIKLRGRSGTAWYNYAGGWRNGDMSAYHTISWEQVLKDDAPLREYRYVHGKPTLVDDIPAAMFGETFTMRSPDGTVVSLVRAESAQQVIDRTEKELVERTAELDEIQKAIGKYTRAADLGDVEGLEDLDRRFTTALEHLEALWPVVEALREIRKLDRQVPDEDPTLSGAVTSYTDDPGRITWTFALERAWDTYEQQYEAELRRREEVDGD